MAALTAALIASAAIAAAGTGYNVYNSEKQRSEMNAERDRAINTASDQQKALAAQKEADAAKQEQIKTRDAQLARLRIQHMGGQGRQGTILTGPLGLPGNGAAAAPTPGGKTLLGS